MLIGSLVFNILLLPKTCNENPQTPIMKLEFQIQEWWNSKLDRYVKFGFGFVGCFLFSLIHFMPKPTFRKPVCTTLCVVMILSLSVFTYSTILEREVIFKDSSDVCKNDLTEIFHDFLFGVNVCMTILGLAYFLTCLFPCLRFEY